MLVLDTVSALPAERKVKIGALQGYGYMFAGDAKEVLKQITRLGVKVGQRNVVDMFEADSAIEPDCTVIMVDGTEKGMYWLTEEAM